MNYKSDYADEIESQALRISSCVERAEHKADSLCSSGTLVFPSFTDLHANGADDACVQKFLFALKLIF